VFGTKSAPTHFLVTTLRIGAFEIYYNRPQMAGFKDHIDVSQDNILRPTVESLSIDEQQRYQDLMSQVEEDACCQLAKVQEEAKEKFLSQFMVDCHQKITKHGEVVIASLLHSLQISNLSESDDIQSIKQYVDQHQNQMK
jgi:hypothetical protein